MRPTSRWGITLPLSGMPLSGQRDLVASLPDLGYTDAWSSEVSGADAFTPLALAAQWTSKDGSGSQGAGPQDAGGLRLGTAVANIYTRGPALLAMSAATLAGLAPGRFVLGIGVSSPAVVTDWNGIALDRPYQRARDTLHFLRRALAGEKVSMHGETFTINGFRLDPAPVPPPALAAIDDDLVDELVVHGSPARCRERVAEYQAAGLDTPVIAIVPAPGVDEAEAVRQLAPA